MGFYPPATLVRDGQRHGVETRPPDVNLSAANCELEAPTRRRRHQDVRALPVRPSEATSRPADGSTPHGQWAVRIGLSYITSVGDDDAEAVVAERVRGGPFKTIRELAQRASLSRGGLEALVESGACDSFGLKRRELLWQLGLVPRSTSVPGSGGDQRQLALPLDPTTATPELPDPTVWEQMLADYRTTNLSVGVHPLELLRPRLQQGVLSSRELAEVQHGRRVAVAGMVVARQRPSTANGVVFILLEDEFGAFNLIVPPPVYDRFRAVVRGEPLLLARGTFERHDRNENILVTELETLGPLAREQADRADVHGSLPGAHHFGHGRGRR
jgi:error-prone DNA polymerase